MVIRHSSFHGLFYLNCPDQQVATTASDGDLQRLTKTGFLDLWRGSDGDLRGKPTPAGLRLVEKLRAKRVEVNPMLGSRLVTVLRNAGTPTQQAPEGEPNALASVARDPETAPNEAISTMPGLATPAEDQVLRSEKAVADRAVRRQAVVMPILNEKRWKRGRLATMAGVGKNSVYEYLDGTRGKITDGNRKAIAEALDLKPEKLPG